MMENFDEEKYFADTINSFDLNFNGFDKGFETSKDTDYSVAGKVNEEDYKYFKTNFGEEIYPRLALGFNTKESLYKLVRNDLLGYENYKGLFAQELNGVTLINENSLLKLLGEDELVYLAKSPIQFNDGIFITDYFADSLIMNSNFAYKNYDELINAYQDPFTANEGFNELKVNGIIKTNYKEKLEPFFKQIEDSKYVEEIITKKENIEHYTYLHLVLNTAYSFNQNFVNDLKAPSEVFYKSLLLENEEKEKVYENFQSYVTYSESLPSNMILVSGNVFNKIYPNKTFDEIEALIKDKEFTLNKNIYSYEEPYVDVTQKVKVKIYELHKDEYKAVNNDITNNANFMVLSKKIHNDLYKSKAYTFGFLITTRGNKESYKGLVDRKFAMSSGITRVTSRTTAKIKEFSKVFEIFNIFSLILSLGILIYYACSVIKDNSYNVGVLKSLGYRGNELSAFYTISFISYSVLTSILYIASFYLLSKLVNNVLVDTLIKSSADLTYAEAIPIVDFNPILILFICSLLLFITLIFSLIYLFILRKYKIIEVIQNEE